MSACRYSVQDNVDHPVSLYAASKKSNELMAHAYSHLYRLPTTGLRFFTVYGPWGRPDMAPVLFTRAILSGETIKVFNHGNHSRDFTYITDIAEGVLRSLDRPAEPDPDWSGAQPNPATSNAPWRIHNIGSNNPVKLGAFIEALENALGKKAKKEFLPPAGRRRARHLRRHRKPDHRNRLSPRHPPGRRHRQIHNLVQGLLSVGASLARSYISLRSSLGYQMAWARPRTAMNTSTAPHKPCRPHCCVIGSSNIR